jgi:hypothetical protein
MMYKTWLIGAAGAVALGLIASTAQAAPIGGLADTRNTATQNGNVDSVAWVRRCHWHRGHRHCRRVWRDYYYDDYGYYGGPYAYGPAFGFYFGGGRHGHYHGHRGHHGGRHGHHGGRHGGRHR